MQLNNKLHNKIMKKGKYVFEMLANYDRTREWPIGRARLDIALSKRIIQKLKKASVKSEKPLSRIIEEAVNKSI